MVRNAMSATEYYILNYLWSSCLLYTSDAADEL